MACVSSVLTLTGKLDSEYPHTKPALPGESRNWSQSAFDPGTDKNLDYSPLFW